ncbi:MAG: gamma carbonic anhydrase family protein [Candidatus Aenigmatarchaeota archaeon]
MAVYEFEGRKPEIPESSYVAESAAVIGDVTLGQNCYIAPGARIKGDYSTIVVGENSNVQENCVIHARPRERTEIENWVTIGHGAIIHGATIHDYAVIGMGAIVSDDTEIGRWSVVGEGAVVTSGVEIEDEHVAVGVPAKTIKKISDSYKDTWKEIKEEYASFSSRYRENLKRVD